MTDYRKTEISTLSTAPPPHQPIGFVFFNPSTHYFYGNTYGYVKIIFKKSMELYSLYKQSSISNLKPNVFIKQYAPGLLHPKTQDQGAKVNNLHVS